MSFVFNKLEKTRKAGEHLFCRDFVFEVRFTKNKHENEVFLCQIKSRAHSNQ